MKYIAEKMTSNEEHCGDDLYYDCKALSTEELISWKEKLKSEPVKCSFDKMCLEHDLYVIDLVLSERNI